MFQIDELSAREWEVGEGLLLETGPGLRSEKGFRVSAGKRLLQERSLSAKKGLRMGRCVRLVGCSRNWRGCSG